MESGEGLEQVDVAVLAGGLGTRIRPVLGDVPKVLAPVGDRPFLDHLIEWLRGFGARRLVLCLGHGADQVIDHLARNPAQGLEIVPSVEPEPLGTAGAIRFARPHLTSEPVLVLNGDTFVDVDMAGFVARHRAQGASLSLLCMQVPSVARYGSIAVDGQGYIARFREKGLVLDRPGLVSAGHYLFSQSMLDALVQRPGPSLESDFLEALPAGTIRAEVGHGGFIDIGTPESLAKVTR